MKKFTKIDDQHLTEYKIRFGQNGQFPDNIIDFDEAKIIVSLYKDGQTITDFVLMEDFFEDTIIYIHQYFNNS